MSVLNNKFPGKRQLDDEVEAYSESMYGYFDYLRKIGKGVKFGRKYFYPAMVAVCTDNRLSVCRDYSHRAIVDEYKDTCMHEEMEKRFGKISSRNDFRKLSKERFSIGQCAEQHAAQQLLYYSRLMRGPINIQRDIYFSKAVRPSTGEVFPYCKNCKALFDL